MKIEEREYVQRISAEIVSMKRARGILVGIILVLILTGCVVNSNNWTDKEITEQWKDYDVFDDSQKIIFDGETLSADNPWNVAVGFIDEGILMLPRTSTEIQMEPSENSSLDICAEISELVRDVSDGVVLNVEIRNLYGDVLKEYQYEIAPDKKEQNINIDLTDFGKEKITMVLSCEPGNNEDGDWLIIKEIATYINCQVKSNKSFSHKNESLFYDIVENSDRSDNTLRGQRCLLFEENEEYSIELYVPKDSRLYLDLSTIPYENDSGQLCVSLFEKGSEEILYQKLVNIQENNSLNINLDKFYNKEICISLMNDSDARIVVKDASVWTSESKVVGYFFSVLIGGVCIALFIVACYFYVKNKTYLSRGKVGGIAQGIALFLVLLLYILNSEHMYDVVNSQNNTFTVPDYKFTPAITSNQDIIQEIVFTKPYIETIQIRMANEHPDEISSVLEYSLWDEECIFSQRISSDNIINWGYVTLNLNQIVCPGKEYRLVIKEVSNNSGINYKVFLGQDNLRENKNLYSENDLLEGELDMVYTYRYFSLRWLLLLLVVIGEFLFTYKLYIKKIANQYRIVEPIVFSITILYIYEGLSFNSLSNINLSALLLSVSFIYGVLLVGSALVSNRKKVYMIVACTFYLLGFINHFVLQFRGTVILPLDIFSVTTAAEVAGSYNIALDRDILYYGLVLLAVLGFLQKVEIEKEKKKLPMLILGVPIVVTCLVCMLVPNINKKLGIAVREDAQTSRSKEIGQIVNFIENIPYCIVPRPDGYSEMAFEELYHKYNEKENNNSSSNIPTIICVMNESWADFSNYDTIDISENYMESFYNIEEGDVIYGNCIVPVFGGGTSNSEFEFLTGYSKLFLGTGSAPYQQYVNSNTESMASYLKEEGYQTVAIHAANPMSWNRNVAYPKLGFDEFISTKNAFEDAEYCRYWVSDKAFFEKIIEVYETREKEELFVFGITIQAHGGYDYENFENTISVVGDGVNYEDAAQYMTLVQDSNEAFLEMISYFAKQEEPVIIAMFGDHLPSLSQAFYEQLYGVSEEHYAVENMVSKYTTPYIIWSNYELADYDMPETLSVNMLAPYVLKASGIELTGLYEFLYDKSKEIPVISPYIIWENGAEPVVTGEYVDDENIVSDYEMFQYGLLFGRE